MTRHHDNANELPEVTPAPWPRWNRRPALIGAALIAGLVVLIGKTGAGIQGLGPKTFTDTRVSPSTTIPSGRTLRFVASTTGSN